jgi:hypothetical protein
MQVYCVVEYNGTPFRKVSVQQDRMLSNLDQYIGYSYPILKRPRTEA